MSVFSTECRHIMPSGAKCHAMALRAMPYCYFHTRLHRFAAAPSPGATERRSGGEKCGLRTCPETALPSKRPVFPGRFFLGCR